MTHLWFHVPALLKFSLCPWQLNPVTNPVSSAKTLAPRTALSSGRNVTHNGHLVSISLSLLWKGHRLGSSSGAKGHWGQNSHLSNWPVAIWELWTPLGR